NDTLARLGGDEFVVLLDGIDDETDAELVAERIVTSVAEPIMLDDGVATIGVSVGIAVANGRRATTEELLANADAAMYEAKRMGRGGVAGYAASLEKRLAEQRELGRDLRRAIASDEFELHYRPVASLETGSIVSLEASLQWNHPARGRVQPNIFIPIANA